MTQSSSDASLIDPDVRSVIPLPGVKSSELHAVQCKRLSQNALCQGKITLVPQTNLAECQCNQRYMLDVNSDGALATDEQADDGGDFCARSLQGGQRSDCDLYGATETSSSGCGDNDIALLIEAAVSSSKNAIVQEEFDRTNWRCMSCDNHGDPRKPDDPRYRGQKLEWPPHVLLRKSRCECGVWYDFRPNYWKGVKRTSVILSIALVALALYFWEIDG